MMLIWILRLEASGVGVRIYILMLGYFTPMPPVTASLVLLLLINAMRMDRNENMFIELGTLNMEILPHWSSVQLVPWDIRSLYFTGV